MAYTSQGSSSSSSSDSKIPTCSKECLKSYEAFQKQYDQQHEALNKSNLEIIGYQMGLESLEARIVVHKKNKAVYEEDNAFLKYDVQVKDISIKEIKNKLENALKEQDDLKLKLEKFETSSKKLTKLINSQISAMDKTGLGYDGQMNESVNDRFKKGEGYHVVPPSYIGNYMPPKADLSFVGLDNYVFKSKVSETITSVPKIETNASKTSKDSLEKPETVRSSAPLIEEWESDSEDENVFKPKEAKKTVKPSLEKNKFVNATNTTIENKNKAEKPRKFSQSPRGTNELLWLLFVRMVLTLNALANKASAMFIEVVGSELSSRFCIGSAVLTKSGQVRVNVAKKSSHKAATSVSAVRRVNTIASRPNVNNALPTTNSYFKVHSPVRRPFNQKSAAKTNNFNENVNTVKVNNVTTAGPKAVVSAAEGNRNNVVKSSACWIRRPKGNLIDHISKYSGSYTLKRFNYDPQGRFKSVQQSRMVYTYYCQMKVNAAKHKLTTASDVMATTKMKNVNEETQIQALVDKKKVIIIEALIRRDLRFEDEGGVDCLSNEVIFEQLILIGSIMASAIICLATNQNFNFSKYIFDNMVKHLDGGVKFLMYLRFVQVFLDNQVE
nr:hypothetical protein [Tanacetum cinerariifolium]